VIPVGEVACCAAIREVLDDLYGRRCRDDETLPQF
jgi:hypothetical protein